MAPRWDPSRPTLAERSEHAAAPPPGEGAGPARQRPVGTRHCWVDGLPDLPGRCAGLLVEWRRDREQDEWRARVVYAVDVAGRPVLVEAWIDARHLTPAP